MPLCDTENAITGMFGIRVDRNQGDQMELTVGDGFFNAPALSAFEEVILCASTLDA